MRHSRQHRRGDLLLALGIYALRQDMRSEPFPAEPTLISSIQVICVKLATPHIPRILGRRKKNCVRALKNHMSHKMADSFLANVKPWSHLRIYMIGQAAHATTCRRHNSRCAISIIRRAPQLSSGTFCLVNRCPQLHIGEKPLNRGKISNRSQFSAEFRLGFIYPLQGQVFPY